jgi:hypothetical protein
MSDSSNPAADLYRHSAPTAPGPPDSSPAAQPEGTPWTSLAEVINKLTDYQNILKEKLKEIQTRQTQLSQLDNLDFQPPAAQASLERGDRLRQQYQVAVNRFDQALTHCRSADETIIEIEEQFRKTLVFSVQPQEPSKKKEGFNDVAKTYREVITNLDKTWRILEGFSTGTPAPLAELIEQIEKNRDYLEERCNAAKTYAETIEAIARWLIDVQSEYMQGELETAQQFLNKIHALPFSKPLQPLFPEITDWQEKIYIEGYLREVEQILSPEQTITDEHLNNAQNILDNLRSDASLVTARQPFVAQIEDVQEKIYQYRIAGRLSAVRADIDQGDLKAAQECLDSINNLPYTTALQTLDSEIQQLQKIITQSQKAQSRREEAERKQQAAQQQQAAARRDLDAAEGQLQQRNFAAARACLQQIAGDDLPLDIQQQRTQLTTMIDTIQQYHTDIALKMSNGDFPGADQEVQSLTRYLEQHGYKVTPEETEWQQKVEKYNSTIAKARKNLETLNSLEITSEAAISAVTTLLNTLGSYKTPDVNTIREDASQHWEKLLLAPADDFEDWKKLVAANISWPGTLASITEQQRMFQQLEQYNNVTKEYEQGSQDDASLRQFLQDHWQTLQTLDAEATPRALRNQVENLQTEVITKVTEHFKKHLDTIKTSRTTYKLDDLRSQLAETQAFWWFIPSDLRDQVQQQSGRIAAYAPDNQQYNPEPLQSFLDTIKAVAGSSDIRTARAKLLDFNILNPLLSSEIFTQISENEKQIRTLLDAAELESLSPVSSNPQDQANTIVAIWTQWANVEKQIETGKTALQRLLADPTSEPQIVKTIRTLCKNKREEAQELLSKMLAELPQSADELSNWTDQQSQALADRLGVIKHVEHTAHSLNLSDEWVQINTSLQNVADVLSDWFPTHINDLFIKLDIDDVRLQVDHANQLCNHTALSDKISSDITDKINSWQGITDQLPGNFNLTDQHGLSELKRQLNSLQETLERAQKLSSAGSWPEDSAAAKLLRDSGDLHRLAGQISKLQSDIEQNNLEKALQTLPFSLPPADTMHSRLESVTEALHQQQENLRGDLIRKMTNQLERESENSLKQEHGQSAISSTTLGHWIEIAIRLKQDENFAAFAGTLEVLRQAWQDFVKRRTATHNQPGGTTDHVRS